MCRISVRIFQIHGAIAERNGGFARGFEKRLLDHRRIVDNPHSSPAAARRRLQQHGIADALGNRCRFRGRGHHAFGTGVVGTPASSASFLAVALSPHRAYRSAGRPHENEALRFDEIGEIGVLREKSITRMNRVHAQRRRRREYPPCVQVTLLRLGTANAHRTVRHANGERIPVGLGEDLNRFNAQLATCAQNANGDFATVRNQQPLDLRPHLHTLSVGRLDHDERLYSTVSPSETRMSRTTPPDSAESAFINFMTSMMHTVSCAAIVSPTPTKGFAPGSGAQ